MKKIGRHTPNSCPTTWGAIVRSGNCLVVFHNPFFPFQPLFKLTKISLKFMCTPALRCLLPSFSPIISVLSIVFYCVGFIKVELEMNEQKNKINALENVAETKLK